MKKIQAHINSILAQIQEDGLFKNERIITSEQQSEIITNNKSALNFCSNNYLGLSNNKKLIQYAKDALDKYGFGMSSVRFICGTQDIHKELELKVSKFINQEDTILYSSCFDANGGLFETLLSDDDAIISDQLNHASIIDGIRLSKAKRFRYENSNMNQLEQILKDTQSSHIRLISTDGVFSMDGFIANLKDICSLAEKYNALVHVDDSHATGFVGVNGKGSIEHCNVLDKIDIITSTFGKALGGASGGFTSSNNEIISLLRQRSRPYLFSNSLAPVITYCTIKVIDLINKSNDLREKLNKNTLYFRSEIQKLGFKIKKGIHPIVPIMLNDAKLAKNIAKDMLSEGIYVVGFSYPVVPKNQARIRVQISASHSIEQLDSALNAFKIIGGKYNII